MQDNILFGKIAYGEADAPVRIPAVLAEVLDALSLRPTVIDVGLDYQVGTGGSRLSLAQRQQRRDRARRAEAPRPLILNEATSALDGQAQAEGQRAGSIRNSPAVASSGCCIAPASRAISTASWS